MKKPDRIIPPLLTVLFALSVYFLCAFSCRGLMSHHEQSQLFLIDTDYFASSLSVPGGLSSILGEFFTQFFNNYWLGAIVVALLFTSVQLLVVSVAKKISHQPLGIGAYLLSFVPSLALILSFSDLNTLLAMPFAVVYSLIFGWFYLCIDRAWLRCAFCVVLFPCFYWLFGPSVFVLAALVCVAECKVAHPLWEKLAVIAACALYCMAIVYVCAPYVAYPLSLQFSGIGYYRVPTVLPLLTLVAGVSVPLVVALEVWLSSPTSKTKRIYAWTLSVISIVACFISISIGYSTKEHELSEYDYLVRVNNWQGILDKAREKHPDLPMSVCATNLALGMTGHLNDNPFEFFQNGAEGLIPPFVKETNSSLVTAEVYFQLGLINTAQRFYFEAMEAIPDFRKSSRCVKRLAETAIIRGDYEVARKYLNLLKKTLFYKKWALRTEQLLDNPTAVAEHPFYGKLKASQIDDEFFFSEPELDKILGQLYLVSPSNSLAKQYLLLYPLLQRDVNKFMSYLQVVSNNDNRLPLLCQQGIVFAFMQKGQEIPHGMVDPMVMQQFTAFAKAMTAKGKDSAEVALFSGSLWYYLVKGNQ